MKPHKELLISAGALVVALLLVGQISRAAPQQQQPLPPSDDQTRPAGPSPPASPRAAADAPPPALVAPPTIQPAAPAVTLKPAPQPQAQPAQTTPSPFKLPTVMPELDANKELLDYDQTVLEGLKFYPSLAGTDLQAANGTTTLDETAYERTLVNRYHDHEQLHAALEQLAQAYPGVTRLYEVGTSVEGRKLWVLEISESPGKHEPLKPEFRYVANMHGNEVVGRQMLLQLARLILENYHHEEPARDAARPTGVKFIKKLVRATRIHLMPTMNPDGFARSAVGCKFEVPSQRGRLNANNVDLNRNFPDAVLGTREDAGTQPEVRALMEWSRREPFVLSANLHGGALVASIPYDGSASQEARANVSAGLMAAEERRSPDHATYLELARAYTRAHPTMWRPEMCYDKCTEYHPEVFQNEGITTGSGWYSLYGALQDWAYENTNDFHITLELGCNQYPPPEALVQYWHFNKAPLLNYMRQVHRGIKGLVSDQLTGRPLAGVRVHVRSIDHNVTTSAQGDYFRLLAPGNYQVAFEHQDYQPTELHVSLRSAMAQIHNVKLRPRNATGAGAVPSLVPSVIETITTLGAGGGGEEQPQPPEGNHAIALATLVMTVVIVLLLVLLAGAYVVQKRRFSRSQSVSVELQPSGRSAGSTGISLPPPLSSASAGSAASALKSPLGGAGGGRSSLSPHVST